MIQAATPEAYQLFHEGSLALTQMEANGIRVHSKRLHRIIAETEATIDRLESELRADPVFSTWRREYGAKAKLSSDVQLARILYDKMGLPCTSWTSGGKTGKKRPSVSEKALQDIDHPFVEKLFESRHLKKMVGTFLKGIQRETVDGLLHSFFNLHMAVTYRSSSDSPNLQNFPKRDVVLSRLVRRCIIARPGRYLWELDFKGAEVGVAAAVTGDPVLIDYVKDKTKDMHRDSAMGLYLLDRHQVSKAIRNAAKSWFVFAEFYGDYYIHCAKNLWEAVDREKLHLEDGTPLRRHLRRHKIKELGELDPQQQPRRGTYEAVVKEFEYDFWEKRFRVYTQWKKQWWNDHQDKGYFHIPTGFMVRMGKEGPLTRNEALNSPIQSSSFHCLLWTLTRLHKWLRKHKMKTCLVNQIHDSMVGDSPPDEIQDVLNEASRIIKEDLPKHYKWLTVPIDVECEVSNVGTSWFDKEEWVRNNSGLWGPGK